MSVPFLYITVLILETRKVAQVLWVNSIRTLYNARLIADSNWIGKRHKLCLQIACKYCIQIIQLQTIIECESGINFVGLFHSNTVCNNSNYNQDSFKQQLNRKGGQSLFVNCLQILHSYSPVSSRNWMVKGHKVFGLDLYKKYVQKVYLQTVIGC